MRVLVPCCLIVCLHGKTDCRYLHNLTTRTVINFKIAAICNTSCKLVVGYKRFAEDCCLHLQGCYTHMRCQASAHPREFWVKNKTVREMEIEANIRKDSAKKFIRTCRCSDWWRPPSSSHFAACCTASICNSRLTPLHRNRAPVLCFNVAGNNKP